jgi:hypothetical protein
VTGKKPVVHGHYWRRLLTMTPEEREFLDEAFPSRDPVTGRMLKGRPGGPGRGWDGARNHGVYNFRALVAEFVEAHGGFVEDVVVDLFGCLMRAAQNGDVAAAKLLLERFCGKDAEQLDVAVGVAKLSDVERATRIASILAAARERAPDGTEPKT